MRKDGTGPEGKGPMTGRGFGSCNVSDVKPDKKPKPKPKKIKK
jgi:hypothetical protein